MKIHSALSLQPIDRLIPYARNSRTHSPEQVAQIAASIREFGFTNPVLIDEQGGVIAGHGRIMAAQSLGLEQVPCLILEGLSDTQKRAYVIADNKLAENAGWNQDLLAAEMQALIDDGYDPVHTGFDERELGDLLAVTQELDQMPQLPDGDREPFQQMTFTLHDEQAEQVKAAMEAAKALGPFIDSPNENSNGNALARICETYLSHA